MPLVRAQLRPLSAVVVPIEGRVSNAGVGMGPGVAVAPPRTGSVNSMGDLPSPPSSRPSTSSGVMGNFTLPHGAGTQPDGPRPLRFSHTESSNNSASDVLAQLRMSATTDSVRDLDDDVTTIEALKEAGFVDAEFGIVTPSTMSTSLVEKFVCGLRPVLFASPDVERRFQALHGKQTAGVVRLAIIAVNLLLVGLIIDLQLICKCSPHWAEWLCYGIIAWLQLVSTVLLWTPDVPASLSLITRRNLAALHCVASSVVMAALMYFEFPVIKDPSFGGYVAFGVQVALLILLSDGLFLQVLPFLCYIAISYGCWLACSIAVGEGAVPPLLLLVCVPVLTALKARLLAYRHMKLRGEFQLQLRLIRHIAQQDRTEAVVTAHRIKAAKANTAREIHQAIMGYACHELRNPLHGLRGCLTELSDRCVVGHAVDEEDLRNFESIDAAVEQMARVTDDVLDFNKLQAGKMQVLSRPSDVRAITERVAMQYRTSDSSIQVRVSPEVPHTIFSDPLRLAQVLTNGVTNALKHTKHRRPITISADLFGSFVHIEVHNEGDGLGDTNVHSLFALYERGNDEQDQTIRGVGLGLPICKMLVTLLGGDIGLEDRGPATVFWFRVPLSSTGAETSVKSLLNPRGSDTLSSSPLVNQDRPLDEPGSQDAAMMNRGYWGRHVGEKPTYVMVVDDELVNRRILMRMLQKQGYTTIELTDGDEIMPKLESGQQVDLCFLDIHMVRSDGRDVARSLRQHGHEFPIVACTGNCSTSDSASYYHSGFDGILSKPFSAADVENIISVLATPDPADSIV